MSGNRTATVETLTAEVRVLMVGSRQVTLSVYNQLDCVPYARIKPFGRVNPKEGGLCVVGKDSLTGTLVRSKPPEMRDILAEARFAKGAEKILTAAVQRVILASKAAGRPSLPVCAEDLARAFARFVRVDLYTEQRCRHILTNLADQYGIERFLLDSEFAKQIRDVYSDGMARWESTAGTADRKAELLVRGYRLSVDRAEDVAHDIRETWGDLPLIVLAGLR